MGVMLVSIGLPMPDARIQAIERYFGAVGEGSGFSYAFLYPSLCRTLQASGRLIRTDEDEGVLILADQRFGQPAYLDAFAAYQPRTRHQQYDNDFHQYAPEDHCDPIYEDD
jgi:Rad3-related DNA helicase